MIALTCRLTVPARRHGTAIALLMLAAAPISADVVVTDGSQFSVDISPRSGEIAIDLMGNLWTLPESGGPAIRLTRQLSPVSRPRWSPDGSRILYQAATADGSRIWQIAASGGDPVSLSVADFHDQDAAWHPEGERIVYASERHDTGLDIWETDLPTGLAWRLTRDPGDETEPAWSPNGRHLAWISRYSGRYRLILRRHGQPQRIIVDSEQQLSGLSWRPDGSLLTFVRHLADRPSLEMAILSDPVLVRPMVGSAEDLTSAVAWRDRMNLYFTADGTIRTRGFEERRSRPLPFSALVENARPPAPRTIARKELKVHNPPQGRLVVRASRLFDGIWDGYRHDMDVVIAAGRIVAVEPRQARDNATVLDLGDVTILPGLIDSWSALTDSRLSGPAMLAYGVTTVVTEDGVSSFDPAIWHGDVMPGPRLLPAARVGPGESIPGAADSGSSTAVSTNASPPPSADSRQARAGRGKSQRAATDASAESAYFLVHISADSASVDDARRSAQLWRDRGVPIVANNRAAALGIGADLLLGAGWPQDPRSTVERDAFLYLSGIADSGVAAVAALPDSRQALALNQQTEPARRFSSAPVLKSVAGLIVAGSKPNRMAPGLALHAELRALQAAGLDGSEVLHTAGRNAAQVLGLQNQVGTITPGALADLVLVAGDPLADVGDALNIVAVVRNGRFFSQVSLLERVAAGADVE